jgi:hypothetical protein
MVSSSVEGIVVEVPNPGRGPIPGTDCPCPVPTEADPAAGP